MPWNHATLTFIFQCIILASVSSQVASGINTSQIVTCGQIASNNKTSFQSKEYPQAYTPTGGTEACTLRIKRRSNICQVRLDFEIFEIDGPTANVAAEPEGAPPVGANNDAGSCKTDVLFITSSGTTVAPICGIMTGQHLYVEYGGSDISIYIMLQGNVQRDRLWNIEISTIPCNSITRAPTGCLQYFSGISGQIKSFNHAGGVHLAKMDNTACIRVEEGMKFIEWSACNPGDVKIIGGTPGTPQTPPECPISDFNDYLTIVGGVQYPYYQQSSNINQSAFTTAPVSTTDRFCDASFATAVNFVRSSVRPFMLHFKTDGMEMPVGAIPTVEASQGFCLKWQQHPQ